MDYLNIMEIVGLVLGGGGLTSLLSYKVARRQALSEARRAENEAKNAENEATKTVQDVYQELIDDVKRDREEQKAYIKEIKEDRAHLRNSRNELREENTKLRKEVNSLRDEVQEIKKEQARQGRKVDVLTPFICGRAEECADRIKVTLKDLSKRKSNKQTNNVNNHGK